MQFELQEKDVDVITNKLYEKIAKAEYFSEYRKAIQEQAADSARFYVDGLEPVEIKHILRAEIQNEYSKLNKIVCRGLIDIFKDELSAQKLETLVKLAATEAIEDLFSDRTTENW